MPFVSLCVSFFFYYLIHTRESYAHNQFNENIFRDLWNQLTKNSECLELPSHWWRKREKKTIVTMKNRKHGRWSRKMTRIVRQGGNRALTHKVKRRTRRDQQTFWHDIQQWKTLAHCLCIYIYATVSHTHTVRTILTHLIFFFFFFFCIYSQRADQYNTMCAKRAIAV